MLRFRARGEQFKEEGEWCRRFAVLAEVLSRSDYRPGRDRGTRFSTSPTSTSCNAATSGLKWPRASERRLTPADGDGGKGLGSKQGRSAVLDSRLAAR